MVEIFGKNYYIDIDEVNERCKTGKTVKDADGNETFEINIFKYEVIKMCLDRVLNEFGEPDEDNELSIFTQTPKSISLNLAFNTLEKNKIIIDDENE